MTPAGSRTALESFLTFAEGGAAKVPQSRTDIAILAAAAAVISANGERNLTIDEVAERAGFTRMTIFRRFGSREQLLLATYSNELRRVIDAVASAADATSSRVERAETVVLQLISGAVTNPIFQRLAQVEPAAIVDLWRGKEFAGQAWGAGLISRLLQDENLDDPLNADEADFVGDVLMRLVVSVALVPEEMGSAPDMDRATYVRRVVERLLPS
ncbi:TetR/AcrR family transcriptional regulator [Nocardia africana]|uniref:Transcriptional regulator BetI n=1 Tax=Nocardia africana TaxID=134964 RepID=A0A378X1H3_9NOCA|nr:TetR/AcrR family transcriptional regulator [Nocardia africana]MCC3312279.1 TetR/AcrR family transcriptional regulator [Nocardia africana]SUA46413.1 transcriptional regulator BetI [Nocardia africana]